MNILPIYRNIKMNKTIYEKQLKKAFITWFEEKVEQVYDIGEDSQKYLSKIQSSII